MKEHLGFCSNRMLSGTPLATPSISYTVKEIGDESPALGKGGP